MQNLEKMVWRMSEVVMVPVMVERWWRVSRRSCAMKSPESEALMPSMARVSDASASTSERW